MEGFRVVCDDCGKTLVITHPEMVKLARESQVTARCRDKCNEKIDIPEASSGH